MTISAPASRADLPRTNWRYWVRPKIIPNIAKKVSAIAPAPAVKRALRKSERSSIGSGVWSSRQAKRSAEDGGGDRTRPRIDGSVQPAAGASMIA